MHYLSIKKLLHCIAMRLVLWTSGRIEDWTASTVHGPVLDTDATVTQLFLESLTPTRSKHAPLMIMLSLYRFSTIEKTVTENRLSKEITKESGMQKKKQKTP